MSPVIDRRRLSSDDDENDSMPSDAVLTHSGQVSPHTMGLQKKSTRARKQISTSIRVGTLIVTYTSDKLLFIVGNHS